MAEGEIRVKNLLILEDDARLRASLAQEFKERGYSVVEAASIAEIPPTAFDFAVLDMRLVGEIGLAAIAKVKGTNPAARIVVLTGYGSIANTVEAMKLGAVDYLRKPVSMDGLESALLGKSVEASAKDAAAEPSFRPLRLDEAEHEYIDFLLTENKGNISKTARELGLHRQSLQRKLKKLP
ncbi:MAG: response regulator [Proteobacteria bacterium]|nr:MAG: response regulator [Pseudomonadota bacterium]